MSTRHPAPGAPGATTAPQLSFDELGTPLREVTFVVLDLETTGGNAETDHVTEIGAVKVRGGEVLGEFGTLVDPGHPIPPSITVLTGITQAMVTGAPRLDAVLPAFLEFASGAVLVAHNAPFDLGFLRAACRRHGYEWPRPTVVCTVRLARRVLPRGETRDHRLGTLAAHFRSTTTPTHRALDDARATVDVLHGLLERVGGLGVRSLEELLDYTPEVSPARRRNRELASHLPHAPGVYLFRGPRDEVLYVGTASDLRRRVRQYFTASETRSAVREMAALATRVDHVECAHPLEARVRELRLLAAHRPRYNRRSTRPERAWWLTLTDEAYPRLSVIRRPGPQAFGPFPSRRAATTAVETLWQVSSVRQCTRRIPAGGRPGDQACPLLDLGRCAAPCVGRQDVDAYRPAADELTALFAGRDRRLLDALAERIDRLAADRRFEEAARVRDATARLVESLDRGQRSSALAEVAELVAARPDGAGGWHFAVVRHGRLASAGSAARGVPPMPVVELLVRSAETVIPEDGPLRGAPPEEVTALWRWLTTPGTRMVRCSQPWTEPAWSAGAWREWVDRAAAGRAAQDLPD
ncbi:DEDD exonuclease domain-containing protein [Actinoalloteichus spitiensis]|uniref:DEDD exonuclease domain-containing protein n=1 Tax=Actinoalloteichus spitiensis TaxID=252394 RepID=UPI00036110E2|nr:DEDD exonuclease domain-containing protein [Actinoalloteichus spitiensis]